MDKIFSIFGECAIVGLITFMVKRGNEYLKLKQEEFISNKFDNDIGE